ncbi:myelin and lymphocyte protein-like [Triplophysa dalaica]|uniref:myelin and lymphocyte protein-like n=1 Tax=Triplophysa dalaica TaxID=1582913 RepID=UPI0024DFD6D6|nr:myelin and lymphocyte protein-like [Triplophysa dalaica]
MAASTQQSMASLPSGFRICSTAPDILYMPELVCGGLVWILVASTHVQPNNPLGWVMCVSVFCFVTTFLWFITFACGGHKNRGICSLLDFLYHLVAAMFYLSASVPLATVTINMRNETAMAIYPFNYYQIDIAAVVFAYLATLLYFIHCILSACRWKSFC